MAWTEETKQKAVSMYTAKNPTPETSMDLVKEIAEALGETVNGVRMILSKADVYVKKVAPEGKTSAKPSGEGTKRVSKEEALASLHSAITDAGKEPDTSITEKLTGKAALYFAELIQSVAK